MKNLKVKIKLSVGFGIIIFFTLAISILSIYGMRFINQKREILVEKTLANTGYVWEMRRNLVSMERYLLLAAHSEDGNEINA